HVGDALPVAVGHRIAHGGPDYASPCLVDDRVLAALRRFVPLAPLHQPYNLDPIRTIQTRFPGTPQVACFDTAFHRGHAAVADRYALPDALYQEGVRRYGFHGLSYEYIARNLPHVAPEIARAAVVVAHLGSGHGRDRRAGAARRHRGELARDPGPGLCPGRVARGRAGRDGQPRGGPAHLDITIPRVGVGDPHRRGAHDRRAHARPRDPSGVRRDDERSPDG